jgi:hypothetical protein
VSNRAKEFFDRWEAGHVEAVASSEKSKEADRLAALCREDAARAGISEHDLENAVEGDLLANMMQALDLAAVQQLAKEQWAEEEGDAES